MRRAAVALSATLMVVAQAGAVQAANPNRSYTLTVCFEGGNQVTVDQAWSGFNVNEVAVIIGDGSVGSGAVYGIPRARSGLESVSVGYDPDDSTVVDGTLLFHGRVVASDRVDRPAGGWSALPICGK